MQPDQWFAVSQSRFQKKISAHEFALTLQQFNKTFQSWLNCSKGTFKEFIQALCEKDGYFTFTEGAADWRLSPDNGFQICNARDEYHLAKIERILTRIKSFQMFTQLLLEKKMEKDQNRF
ncbi:MAG: hypothetical protein WCT18_04330 [Patescibacteria group bacterium]